MRHEQPAVQCTQRRREVQGTGQRDGAMHRAKRGAMHQTGERGRCNAPNKAWCNAPRENGCNAPNKAGCNAPRERGCNAPRRKGAMHREGRGAMHRAERARRRRRERRNAPNAERGNGGSKTGTHRKATSPQRDLSQGAMGGSRLFGKSTCCVRLTWRRTVRALPWAGLECPDMSG